MNVNAVRRRVERIVSRHVSAKESRVTKPLLEAGDPLRDRLRRVAIVCRKPKRIARAADSLNSAAVYGHAGAAYTLDNGSHVDCKIFSNKSARRHPALCSSSRTTLLAHVRYSV